jgi:N-acetylglucosamine-6-phosphate deacetylase
MTAENRSHFIVNGIHYATGKPVSIVIRDGAISDISDISDSNVHTVDDLKLFVAPGLIDNQINGFSNVDFSGNDLSAGGIINAAKAIWGTGVTSFLPTLITNSHENLIRNFTVFREAMKMYENLADSVPGYHLEGPYISPDEGYRGCHPVQYIRKPLWNEFSEYQAAAGGKIIEVTIAPELEGSMDFIKKCREKGIVVAMGHTNSTKEIIDNAVLAGVSLSTHLGNGCANFIHRHFNPIWPQLANDKLAPTIIADGFHLLPEELCVFLKVKGPSNMILTSDVMYLAGMAPGRYVFMESEVELTKEGMLRNTALNCLAGASFPLKTGVANMMKFTGCSMENAIDMASGNVAAVYGLNDRGSLTVGKRADLILFGMDGEKLDIKKTWVNGKLVFTE